MKKICLEDFDWLKRVQASEVIRGVYKPARGRSPVDHSGRRFSMLVALECVGRRVSPSRPTVGSALWRCKCDCGKETVVIAKSLVDGTTQSCGCIGRIDLMAGGLNKKDYGEARFNDLYLSYKRRAAARKLPFTLTKPEFRTLTKGDCYYCGLEPAQIVRAGHGVNGEYTYNGIDRVDSAVGYIAGNVRSCCKFCNMAKASMTEQEFYTWVARVYSHLSGRMAKQARFEQTGASYGQ